MTDSEKLVKLIEYLRKQHEIPPDMMKAIHTLVGVIRYSEIIERQ